MNVLKQIGSETNKIMCEREYEKLLALFCTFRVAPFVSNPWAKICSFRCQSKPEHLLRKGLKLAIWFKKGKWNWNVLQGHFGSKFFLPPGTNLQSVKSVTNLLSRFSLVSLFNLEVFCQIILYHSLLFIELITAYS